MAWDQSRPVPWLRLVRDWLIYASVMVVVFLLIYRDDFDLGLLAGLLSSGPLFVLVGAALAKLGYQRKTLKDLRAESAARAAARDGGAGRATAASGAAARSRPAPTRRTSTGPNRPKRKR